MTLTSTALFSIVGACVLASLRVAVTFAWMPAPFGAVTPMPIRALLSLFVGIACAWTSTTSAELPTGALGWISAAATEAVVGTLLGVTVRITLACAEQAGSWIGQSMGLGFASTIDPTFGDEALPTTRILAGFGVIVFFAIDGPAQVFAALFRSLRAVPPGASAASLLSLNVASIGGDVLVQGFRIAAPIVATMLAGQIAFGVVARTAPRLSVFELTFAFAVLTGAVLLWDSADVVAHGVGVELRRLEGTLVRVGGGG